MSCSSARSRPTWYAHVTDSQLVNKRRLACIKAVPDGIPLATEGLAELVDIFPTDQESWLELASLYLHQNKYAQAVFALEELVLLAPQNSFYLLKYAETLYTAGDVAHAYKIYLRILELGEGNLAPDSGHKMDRVKGPWVRTLWGLKMVRYAPLTLVHVPVPEQATAEGLGRHQR